MAQSKTDSSERDVLDWLLRTRDAQMYVVLLLADPTESGAPVEPATADGYARQPIHFAAAATVGGASTAKNDGTVAANALTASFGPVANNAWPLWGMGIARSGVRATNDLVYKEAFAGQPLNQSVGSYFDVRPNDVTVEEQ